MHTVRRLPDRKHRPSLGLVEDDRAETVKSETAATFTSMCTRCLTERGSGTLSPRACAREHHQAEREGSVIRFGAKRRVPAPRRRKRLGLHRVDDRGL
jgi:hypothetical protein